MAVLKQHRKANLELDGRKLKGNFEVSLTNQTDRETITEFVAEIRKQLRQFSPAKREAAKKKVAAKKKTVAKRKVKAPRSGTKSRVKRRIR